MKTKKWENEKEEFSKQCENYMFSCICDEMAAVSIFPPIFDICIIISVPLALCYNPNTTSRSVIDSEIEWPFLYIKDGEKPDNPPEGDIKICYQ